MAVWNPQNQTAALCHIDEKTDLSSVQLIFDNLRNKDDICLDVHLLGGNKKIYSKSMIYKVITLIENSKNVTIKSANVTTCDQWTFEYHWIVNNEATNWAETGRLAIDSRSGEIFNVFDDMQFCCEEHKYRQQYAHKYHFQNRLIKIENEKEDFSLMEKPGLEFETIEVKKKDK